MPDTSGRIPLQILVFSAVTCLLFVFIIFGFPIQNALVLFLAGIVFVIAFVNTNLALIIVILSMLLSPELRAGKAATRSVNIRIEDLFVFIIFFGWMAKMAVKKELGLFRKNPLNVPILTYFTICLISTLVALMGGSILLKDSFFYLLKYFEYYLIYFMVGNNLRSVRQAKVFVYVMMATAFVVCIIAWTQIPSGQRLTAPFEIEGGEPNTFAGYLNLMMAMILALSIYAKDKKLRFMWWAFFGFAVIPFVLTLSREGWISFIPMICAFILLNRKARLPLIIVAVLAVVLLPSVMPRKVFERAENTFAPERSYRFFGKKVYVSESTSERIDAWQKALRKMRNKPLIGYGVPGGSVIDNQYTRVMIETGLVGFASFMWLIILLFRFALRTYRESEDDFLKAVSLGFLCGFTALLFQSLGAAVFILIRIMEPFWFLAALVIALPDVVEEEKALANAGVPQAA
ncbi:MAG: O-antigen ligase family protein [Candidatus Omnitrophica bacterium]|nr:O-antigen ligase family protein [Candidatus Omnitrophota bacterium]